MDVIFGNLDLWGQAISNTLIVFFAGGIIALILGLIVGAMRVSPVPIAVSYTHLTLPTTPYV